MAQAMTPSLWTTPPGVSLDLAHLQNEVQIRNKTLPFSFPRNVLKMRRNPLGLLTPLHRLGHGHARQVRVGREALPVAAAGGRAAQGAGYGTQLHVDALGAELAAQGRPTPPEQVAAEGGGRVDAGREHRVAVRCRAVVSAVPEHQGGKHILYRTPTGPSCRQKASKPSRGTDPVLPMQRSLSQPTPLVRFTFSTSVSWATNALAFVYASSQPGPPLAHGDGKLGVLGPRDGACAFPAAAASRAAASIRVETIVGGALAGLGDGFWAGETSADGCDATPPPEDGAPVDTY